MPILRDEPLPRDLAALIDGHDVSTVRDEEWSSTKSDGGFIAWADGLAPRGGAA